MKKASQTKWNSGAGAEGSADAEASSRQARSSSALAASLVSCLRR
jgi:hypothetical protein